MGKVGRGRGYESEERMFCGEGWDSNKDGLINDKGFKMVPESLGVWTR